MSTTTIDTIPGSAFSALVYDPFLWLGERAGMAARRRTLVAGARGDVLEIGAGTGLNLPHYPPGLSRLVLAEPVAAMAGRLRARVAKLGRKAEVVLAPAEALPFATGSFDTVVATMVLCTAQDPRAALAEVRRVLRPGGALLFIEHVRSEHARLARWQDRLNGPWSSFADGCRCNQPTLELLDEAGLAVTVRERAEWRGMPALVRPLVVGRAGTEAERSA